MLKKIKMKLKNISFSHFLCFAFVEIPQLTKLVGFDAQRIEI